MAEEDDLLPFLESIRTSNWQLLGSVLKHAGPQRAHQLVTSLVDHDQRATALTVCARAPTPPSPSSPSSQHHHNHHNHHRSLRRLSSNTLHPPPNEGRDVGGGGGGGGEEEEDLLETCRVLVNYGADLNHVDRAGRTALHWAVESHKAPLAALLLEMGAELHVQDEKGFTAMHIAVRAASVDCLHLLLRLDPELLEERDSQGTPPLTLAVQKGHSDLCRQLLQAGADVTAQELHTLRTPLHYALYLNHLHIFILLLSYKPNLRTVDHRGTTVVHRSCAAADNRYLTHVLSSGCDHVPDVINMEDKEGATPVMVACQSNSLANVQLLVDSGANVSARDVHGRTALHHCVENTDTECAELLLRTDPSLLSSADHEGLTPLHMAVIAGNVALIRLLLKRGASLQCKDQEEHTVAHWATVCGHCRVLDVLMEYGAELSLPDRHQAFPVHYAAQMTRPPGDEGGGGGGVDDPGEDASSIASGDGDVDVPPTSRSSSSSSPHDPHTSSKARSGHARLLRKLLASGVSPEVRDMDGRTPVIWAASAGNVEACRILVDAGADVNSADKDGLSALHCAASRGHADCVRALVNSCGARVDPVDRNECTPLFYATTLGHDESAKTLLELGASPNHTDNRGRTTAHCAAVTGSRDSLEVLRKQGVDLWQPTAKGDYPIHEAAQAGHVEAVDYLLEIQGAKNQEEAINTPNRDGRTCLHIAALTNNLFLAKYLLDHHADVNAVMRNKEGKNYSPYDAAVAKSNKEAADYLQSRGGQAASGKRPSSSKSTGSKSKDRPSSSKSTSSKSKDRPLSGKGEERPPSSKSRDRPSSSKSGDRPASGKSEERPSSGKVKDRPASGKVKDRPSSGKAVDKSEKEVSEERLRESSEGHEARETSELQQQVEAEEGEGKTRAESDRNGVQSAEAHLADVDRTERPKSSSSSATKKKSRSSRDSREPSSDEARSRSSSPTAKDTKAVHHTDDKPVRSDSAEVGEDVRTSEPVVVVVVNDDKQPENRPSSSSKTAPRESASRPSTGQQSPTQTHTNSDPSHESLDPDINKEDQAKTGSSPKKTVRVSDTREERPTRSKNKKAGDSVSASANRGKHTPKTSAGAPKASDSSRRAHPSSKQKQTRRTRRSRSSSSSSSNRSKSRSSSRESRSSDMSAGHQRDEQDENDGEGLNLFSDNEHTDHEDNEATPAGDTCKATEEAATHEDLNGHGEDGQEGGKEKGKRPKSSQLISTVQDSVKRFERDRRSIRQLQQVRRAEIYSNHCRNVALFHSMLRVHGTPNGVPAWDHILHYQQDQNRGKGGMKSSGGGDSKENTVASPKDGADQSRLDDDKDSDTGKSPAASEGRHGGPVSAKGNNHGDHANDDSREQPRIGGSPPRSPSPRRPQKHYDYGDPQYYRQIQRQRAEDMHRRLLKAYRPALPPDLFNNGKAQEKRPSTSLRSARSSRPSTSKSLPPRLSPCQGRPTSMTSEGSPQQDTANPNGMSHAQFKAVQRSYTIMTTNGTRTIRPRSGHHSTWSQSQRHANCTGTARNESACSNGTVDHRDHASSSPDYSKQNSDTTTPGSHR